MRTRPTPYVASLRIYQPIEAFTPDQQSTWRAAAGSRDTSLRSEQAIALRRTIRPDLLSPDLLSPDLLSREPLDEGVHLLEHDGGLYACPWTTKERCQLALELFRESLPANVVAFFLPAGIQESFQGEEEQIPQIQTETWAVPPRWFTLFQPEEREISHLGSEPSVRYRTTMGQARRRAAKHLRTIRGAFGDGPVTLENEVQARWLEEFHPGSLVELDYGGLAGYLAQVLAEEGGLEEDSSVADVLDSLAGLAQGDGLMAGLGYQRLMARWRRVAIFEHAS